MTKNNNIIYSNPKQAVLPMLIQDYLDICDPVLTFDRFMGGIELEKYLKNIPQHDTGRLRYDPVSMLKTVLFGFMANGYISLRELEDQCKVNLRFMYLMDHQAPSYRTFGYFINEVLADSIEEIFQDINKKIFETEHVDLQHLYIDGSKFEANANKYSWVWKKATEKSSVCIGDIFYADLGINYKPEFSYYHPVIILEKSVECIWWFQYLRHQIILKICFIQRTIQMVI